MSHHKVRRPATGQEITVTDKRRRQGVRAGRLTGRELHEAVPAPSVVPVQVSIPFRVNTTGFPPTGAAVTAFVNTADTAVASPKSPVAALTANVVRAAGAATVTVVAGELAGWSKASPAKLAATATAPGACSTVVITQLATPVALVVPAQICAVDPPPNVKVTVRPATPAPATDRPWTAHPTTSPTARSPPTSHPYTTGPSPHE